MNRNSTDNAQSTMSSPSPQNTPVSTCTHKNIKLLKQKKITVWKRSAKNPS